jgi:hypothetical protein
MRFLSRSSLLVIVLLLGVAACVLPGVSQVDPVAQATSVAQTLAVIIQSTQQTAFTSLTPTSEVATSTETFTPVYPSQTATGTLTATSIFTPTPFLPQISVSIPTNCRTGPGSAYPMVGALLVGKTVQVYARDPTGTFWYIENPDSPGQFCWVWGQYATITGLTYILPMYTPPPTPTATATPPPSFDASYSGLVVCTGWWPEIRLKNTGEVTFRSVGISLKDTDTSTSVYNSSDGFTDNPDCVSTSSRKALLPDRSVTVSAPGFTYDPTGHKLRASITLCSDTGQSGVCVVDTITFTP